MIEHSFSRMGTSVKVLLPAGDEAMLDFVHARSWNLEALWSRFIGTSDIAMLALAGGQAVQVATETIELVEQMLQAHFATEGFFDPTLMAALNEAGGVELLRDSVRARNPEGLRLAYKMHPHF